MSWPDRATRIVTGLTVAGLAGVAGAISFAHMAALAVEHGQTGWKSGAFPVSVDGLELVSSLYILAQHRAGRRSGVLPWAALLVGTAASLAANVAVGGHDPVGRALAGWPAISLLVSIKMLFSMFDHDENDQRTAGDDQRTVPDGSPVPGTVPQTVPDNTRPSGTTGGPGTDSTGDEVSADTTLACVGRHYRRWRSGRSRRPLRPPVRCTRRGPGRGLPVVPHSPTTPPITGGPATSGRPIDG